MLAGNLHGIFSDESQVLQVKTYENPGPIVLLNATHDWLSVSWTPPPDNSSHLHLFYYGKVEKTGRIERSEKHKICNVD